MASKTVRKPTYNIQEAETRRGDGAGRPRFCCQIYRQDPRINIEKPLAVSVKLLAAQGLSVFYPVYPIRSRIRNLFHKFPKRESVLIS